MTDSIKAVTNILVKAPKSKWPLWINKNDIFTLTSGYCHGYKHKWSITAYMRRFSQKPFIEVYQSTDVEGVKSAFREFGNALEMIPATVVSFMSHMSPHEVFVNPCAVENMKVILKNDRWIIEMMSASVYLAVDGGETEEEAITVAEEWNRKAIKKANTQYISRDIENEIQD